MATATRSRSIPAAPQRVWEVLADPHHMPRWWPGVTRVEGVEDQRFTQVFKTKHGRPVRMDFHVLVSEPPWRFAFEQELEGSPFGRFLSEALTEISLEPEGSGTRVTIAQSQKGRGYSRTGSFLLRRATAKKLVEALDALEQVCG